MAGDAVAVLLPGQGYTLAHPLMYYAGAAAAEAGLRLVKIAYGDTGGVPLGKIAEQTSGEVLDSCRSASKVIFIGKSLGTFVMAHLLRKEAVKMPVVAAAWLTPLLGEDSVYQAMRDFDRPAAAVIGSLDGHFLPERLGALPTSTELTILDNANHSLEVAGDVEASVLGMQRTVAALKSMMSRALST